MVGHSSDSIPVPVVPPACDVQADCLDIFGIDEDGKDDVFGGIMKTTFKF